jgi:hypothetical protein
MTLAANHMVPTSPAVAAEETSPACRTLESKGYSTWSSPLASHPKAVDPFKREARLGKAAGIEGAESKGLGHEEQKEKLRAGQDQKAIVADTAAVKSEAGGHAIGRRLSLTGARRKPVQAVTATAAAGAVATAAAAAAIRRQPFGRAFSEPGFAAAGSLYANSLPKAAGCTAYATRARLGSLNGVNAVRGTAAAWRFGGSQACKASLTKGHIGQANSRASSAGQTGKGSHGSGSRADAPSPVAAITKTGQSLPMCGATTGTAADSAVVLPATCLAAVNRVQGVKKVYKPFRVVSAGTVAGNNNLSLENWCLRSFKYLPTCLENHFQICA